MKWIKASERLPEFGEWVLVYCNIYGRYIGSYQRIYDTEFGNWHDGKELGVLPPTHWVPLPAPPTEGEDAPSEQEQDAIGFLYWLTDVNSPYAVMYGGTPELEKDFRIATENEDFTIEEVYEIYKKQKQTRKP